MAALILANVLCASWLILTSVVSRAADDPPTVSFDPVAAPPGWQVVASGDGWSPTLGPVSIYRDRGESLKDAAALAQSQPDQTGHFSTSMTVPFESPGNYVFYACQACGDVDSLIASSGSFTVAPPLTPTLLVDPGVASPGSTISATGTGWNPRNGLVSIFPSEQDAADPSAALITVDPDPTGNISTPLHAPDALGDQVLFACQDCGDADAFPLARAALTVQPAPSPSPRLVIVPNVIGDTAAKAGNVLVQRGLEPTILWVGSGRDRGSVVTQNPAPGTRVPPGTAVTVTARRTAVIVIAPTGRSWARPASGGALLILVAAAGALFWWRPRRQRAWVRRHVRTEPRPGPPAEVATKDLADVLQRAVRLELHRDRGTQTLEEVGP